MKTWTNPTVEELEVKNTAFFFSIWQVEEANGKLDDSLIHGHDPVDGNNPNPGEGEGNEGDNGNEGDEGFGNES